MFVHSSEPLYLGPDGSNLAGVPSTDTKWIWYMVPFRVVDLTVEMLWVCAGQGSVGPGWDRERWFCSRTHTCAHFSTELHPELPGPADWELSELLHGLTHGHRL